MQKLVAHFYKCNYKCNGFSDTCIHWHCSLQNGPSKCEYAKTQAALKILGTTNKQAFTESPLVRYLYTGAKNEGYWNSLHVSLQFEDVVEGHAHKQNVALSVLNMSKGYGGGTNTDERHYHSSSRTIPGSVLTCFVSW